MVWGEFMDGRPKKTVPSMFLAFFVDGEGDYLDK